MSRGILDNREYDAEVWGEALLGLPLPFEVWEVVRPAPHENFWIVTAADETVITAADDGRGFPTPGICATMIRHFEELRADAAARERAQQEEMRAAADVSFIPYGRRPSRWLPSRVGEEAPARGRFYPLRTLN